MEKKLDILPSFLDILTEIGGDLSLGLSQGLATVKVHFSVCVSISWFICSLKIKKSDILLSCQEILTNICRHIFTDLSQRLTKMTHLSVCPSVGALKILETNVHGEAVDLWSCLLLNLVCY